MGKFCMLFILLHLLVITSLASAKMYTIPEGWTVTNNRSLQQVQSSTGSYRLVSVFSSNSTEHQSLLSDNGTFALAFLDFNGTGSYYLSLLMGSNLSSSRPSDAAPVWTANRGQPVAENAVLTRSNGQLKLLSNRTKVAWSSSQGIASVSIGENGNLELQNETGETVWQSFDHPTDVLLTGQRIITGQRLVSNNNLSTMSEGMYTVTIEPSGVVVYLNAPSKQQQPYFLWDLTGSLLSQALTPCPDYQVALNYTATGVVNMAYESNLTATAPRGQACSPSLTVTLSSTGESGNRFLQLQPDGDLSMYKLDELGHWTVDFSLTKYLPSRKCSLPLACGSYGICENGGECKCLGHEPSNFTSSATSCSRPAWPSVGDCSLKYVTDFITISGARYFTNQYMSPDRVTASVSDCLSACRDNCSCSALFYNSATRNCYMVPDALGSLTVDQPQQGQYVGFLKFHNRSRPILPKPPASNSNIVIISSTVATSTVLIACSVLLLVCVLRSKRRQDDEEINRLLTTLQGPPHRFSYWRLAAATKGFSKHLGTGGFGSVYEGNLRDGRKLAVKKLHSTKQGQQKQFITEVASLGIISHKNIVRLCGFCAEPSHCLLVYEYMPNGSLDRWIFGNSGASTLEWRTRFSIALGTARGLAYLHEESREPIIHLDIKPQNILLDENFEAKVGDFGMAKLLMSRDTTVVTGVRGTPGYLAPEWLLQSTATKKCDVYSYGMVLLELIGGRKNLDPTKLDSNLSWYFPAWAVQEIREGKMMDVVDSRIRDEVNNAEAERMIKVALWCIQENPATRPSMDAVVQMLEGQEDILEPPLTFHFAVQAPGIVSITASSSCTATVYRAAAL